MESELKVICDYYELMVYVIQRVQQFPRHHRYSLGIAVENRLRAILRDLLAAKYAREKAGLLEDAKLELDVLRFQLRLAMDLGALPIKSHGHATKLLLGVGAQVGGWLKSREGRGCSRRCFALQGRISESIVAVRGV